MVCAARLIAGFACRVVLAPAPGAGAARPVHYATALKGTDALQGTRRPARYIDQVFGVFPDWHARVVGTIDRGDTVVAEIRMAEQTTWQVTRFRGGKMTGFTAYGDRGEALEAAGLSK